MNEIFSDYDLSLICTSQCDDDYLQCVSSCSDNNCLLDCNRAAVACSECKFSNDSTDNSQFHQFNIQLVPATLIVLKVVLVATTPFAFVM